MLFNKIKTLIIKKILGIFQRNFDELKILQGQTFLEVKRRNYKHYDSINQAEVKIFSQFGEDGIIDYLIYKLELGFLRVVEVGTSDYSESNTRFLFQNGNSEALIIDSDKNLSSKVKKLFQLWRGNIDVVSLFVNKNNLLTTLKEKNFDKDLDLFSLDIDGVDYWIIESLPNKISKIFIAEYNANFGPQLEVTVPYNENFDRTNFHYSNLGWGMSLKALIKLMDKKGFYFVGTNLAKCNAFFVEKKIAEKFQLKIPNTNDLKKFTKIKIREGLNTEGKLALYNKKDKIKSMHNIKLIDLNSGSKLTTFGELLENNEIKSD